jgi:hypothetical protein
MNKYLMRAMQTSPDEFTELGEALDGSVAVVDWTGTGGSDILYNANPRFFGGGTYLYREDQRFQNTIPVYKPAEFLEGIEGRYCIPLPTDEKTGFYLLTLKDDCLMLYRNIGPRSNPVFEASKEKVLCMEELLKKLRAPKGASLASLHSFTLPGNEAVHLLMSCSDWSSKYWPDGMSLWRDNEHPTAGFGRGYDDNGQWRGKQGDTILYVIYNSGSNENPVYKDVEEICRFRSWDHVLDAVPADLDGDGKPELLVRMNIDRLYMLKTDKPLKPVGSPTEMKCSPLQRAHYFTSFFPFDINRDGKTDILVSGNPGTVFWLENTDEGFVERPPLLKQGGDVRAETLSVPCFIDADNDKDLDLVVGDSSGYLWYFENTANEPYKFSYRAGKPLKTKDGKRIRNQAGDSGSIQGPAEKRWGYTNPLAVDWDGDGLVDLLTNDITGKITWYRNIGTRTHPVFDTGVVLQLNGKDFATAWRSRPALWNNGRLIAVNIDGLAQFFEKDEKDCTAVREGRLLRYTDGCAVKCCGPGGHLGRTVLFACDWDGDGNTDIIGGTHRDLNVHINAFFPRKATLFWLKNAGTDSEPVFERPRLITFKDGTPIDLVCHKCSPWCTDLDGDGEPDIVSGAEDGKVYMWFRRELKWDWEPSKDFRNP